MKRIGILLMCLFTLTLSACQSDTKIMDTFIGTPHLFIVQDGEIVTSVSPGDGSDNSGHAQYFESTPDFDKLMNSYNLVDANKKSGEMINVSYAEFMEMMDKKESFVLIATQTSCGYCKKFKEDVLNDYINENGIKVYEVNFTLEESSDVAREAFASMKELVKNDE